MLVQVLVAWMLVQVLVARMLVQVLVARMLVQVLVARMLVQVLVAWILVQMLLAWMLVQLLPARLLVWKRSARLLEWGLRARLPIYELRACLPGWVLPKHLQVLLPCVNSLMLRPSAHLGVLESLGRLHQPAIPFLQLGLPCAVPCFMLLVFVRDGALQGAHNFLLVLASNVFARGVHILPMRTILRQRVRDGAADFVGLLPMEMGLVFGEQRLQPRAVVFQRGLDGVGSRVGLLSKELGFAHRLPRLLVSTLVRKGLRHADPNFSALPLMQFGFAQGVFSIQMIALVRNGFLHSVFMLLSLLFVRSRLACFVGALPRLGLGVPSGVPCSLLLALVLESLVYGARSLPIVFLLPFGLTLGVCSSQTIALLRNSLIHSAFVLPLLPHAGSRLLCIASTFLFSRLGLPGGVPASLLQALVIDGLGDARRSLRTVLSVQVSFVQDVSRALVLLLVRNGCRNSSRSFFLMLLVRFLHCSSGFFLMLLVRLFHCSRGFFLMLLVRFLHSGGFFLMLLVRFLHSGGFVLMLSVQCGFARGVKGL